MPETHPKRTPAKGFNCILIEGDMGIKVEEYTTGLLPGMGTARILFQNEVPDEYGVKGTNASAGVFNYTMVSERLTSTKLLIQHDSAGAST